MLMENLFCFTLSHFPPPAWILMDTDYFEMTWCFLPPPPIYLLIFSSECWHRSLQFTAQGKIFKSHGRKQGGRSILQNQGGQVSVAFSVVLSSLTPYDPDAVLLSMCTKGSTDTCSALCCSSHNSQEMEITYMSFNRWITKIPCTLWNTTQQ